MYQWHNAYVSRTKQEKGKEVNQSDYQIWAKSTACYCEIVGLLNTLPKLNQAEQDGQSQHMDP